VFELVELQKSDVSLNVHPFESRAEHWAVVVHNAVGLQTVHLKCGLGLAHAAAHCVAFTVLIRVDRVFLAFHRYIHFCFRHYLLPIFIRIVRIAFGSAIDELTQEFVVGLYEGGVFFVYNLDFGVDDDKIEVDESSQLVFGVAQFQRDFVDEVDLLGLEVQSRSAY